MEEDFDNWGYEDPRDKDCYYEPKYFYYIATSTEYPFASPIEGTLNFLSRDNSVYSFNEPPEHILRYQYSVSFSDEDQLTRFGIEEGSLTHMIDKYPYVMYREPIYGLEDENQNFLKILLKYHESDSYKTQKGIEEDEKNEWVATTKQLLNFHLFKFKGNPMDFTDNIRTIVEGIDDESFSAVQLKRKVYKWIDEINEEFTRGEQTLKGGIPENNPSEYQPLKLQWNGSKSALYKLFAQLTETHNTAGVTILNYKPKVIARFLNQSFEGFQDEVKTIRQIQKYRKKKNGDPSDAKPPRDALTLDGIDFEPD